MDGFNASNGTLLTGIAHLRQSIRDILTTPLGSRVMRRDYGSDLPRLVDAPINKSTIMDIYAATADALAKWEPRFKLTKCTIVTAAPGTVTLDLTGEYLPDGKEVTLDGIEVN
ncbi:GPW/gp25 family protein [Aquabacterium sp.]|uniref:GPW/gp25 family protein n=1 Tax=Aquabacterium sp. TaxID=1872578 RepID=UPI0025BA2E56|nr:GPW/gp25 family protein [Aquabacterium sp.]